MNNFCKKGGAAYSSEKTDWETPQDFFDKLNDEFGFTLDVCASAENAKCDRFYTKQDNCLVKDWSGEKCWMNPPYGREISAFIRKAYSENITHGVLTVCLIPARTDTSYWHDYIFNKASDIRFIRGRLKFSGCKHPAPFPSAVVVYS